MSDDGPISNNQQNEGFFCECGEFHEFGVYVMAHWDELLIHTCDKCGRQHEVKRGWVTPKKLVRKETW